MAFRLVARTVTHWLRLLAAKLPFIKPGNDTEWAQWCNDYHRTMHALAAAARRIAAKKKTAAARGGSGCFAKGVWKEER